MLCASLNLRYSILSCRFILPPATFGRGAIDPKMVPADIALAGEMHDFSGTTANVSYLSARDADTGVSARGLGKQRDRPHPAV